jgi:hypothetical protein
VFTNFAEPAVEDVEAEPAVDEAAGAGSESDFIVGLEPEPAVDGVEVDGVEADGAGSESDLVGGLVTPSARAEPTIRPVRAVVIMSFFNMRILLQNGRNPPRRDNERASTMFRRNGTPRCAAPICSALWKRFLPATRQNPARRGGSFQVPCEPGAFANDSLILSTL